jgi:hypothetical protein
MSAAILHKPLEAPLVPLIHQARQRAASLSRGNGEKSGETSGGTRTHIERCVATVTIPYTHITIITPAILAMKTHDLQSDESHAQRLPTRSSWLITDVPRPSSIMATNMPRGLLGVPPQQRSQYQLLSIRSGPSKASLNVSKSGMI